MDVLNDFIAGKVSKAQATVLLSGIGLSEANVTMLLDDAEDGTVDTAPSEQELAETQAEEAPAQ
jgi:hypothetical protein